MNITSKNVLIGKLKNIKWKNARLLKLVVNVKQLQRKETFVWNGKLSHTLRTMWRSQRPITSEEKSIPAVPAPRITLSGRTSMGTLGICMKNCLLNGERDSPRGCAMLRPLKQWRIPPTQLLRNSPNAMSWKGSRWPDGTWMVAARMQIALCQWLPSTRQTSYSTVLMSGTGERSVWSGTSTLGSYSLVLSFGYQ